MVATFLYTLIGYAGYLMFGNFVSDEVSLPIGIIAISLTVASAQHRSAKDFGLQSSP